MAFEYFTNKSSLFISLEGFMPSQEGSIHSKDVRYSFDRTAEFYRDNNFELPELLAKSRCFAQKPKSHDLNAPPGNPNAPDLDWVRFLARDEEEALEGIVAYKIDFLEKLWGKYECKAWIFFRQYDGLVEEQQIRPWLGSVRPKLTDEEYYTLLVGLIYSRQIYGHIFIKNDGDLDLSELEIRIMSPFSRIAGNRNDTIVSIEAATLLPHSIDKTTCEAIIRLPIFKKGESLMLNTVTRENMIMQNDITYNYKEIRSLNKRRMGYGFLLVFLAVIAFHLAWPGKRNSYDN